MPDAWNPDQYERFREERLQPVHDLLALIRPSPGMQVLDLGCGTGEPSMLIAERFPDARVVGVDNAPSMLERALARATDRVSFRLGDIEEIDEEIGEVDLLFSNAALHWVEDNEGFFRRVLSRLAHGAQLAVQMPRNDEHATHRLAADVAATPTFARKLEGFIRRSPTLTLERYAELLWEHGFRQQQCTERIYPHQLESTGDAIEWVKGTTLTPYLGRLSPDDGEAFLSAYRRRVFEVIGEHRPYFYPFRRMLLWGRKTL